MLFLLKTVQIYSVIYLQKCEKSCNNLFLVGMSRTPVPDGNKVDIFCIRELHLININDTLYVQFLVVFHISEQRVSIFFSDLVIYAVANIVFSIQII